MSVPLAFETYSIDEREELCLLAGKSHDKRIMLIPPLFDEMNRMRRMLVDVMRLLDERGVGSLLPDLPGTNESLFAQENASLTVWKEALSACSVQFDGLAHIASFRGGCLVDQFAENARNWRLTPVKGRSLLRTMMRTRIAADKEAGQSTTMAELTKIVETQPILLAGNNIGPSLFAELQGSAPDEGPDIRTARLESDSQPADVQLSGAALWLRAEPDSDETLSNAIAGDLAAWVES